MSHDPVPDRLTQIMTRWSLLVQAHGEAQEDSAAARAAVIERYQTAIYKYLLAAVRNLDIADELFQEFALKFVRGDFRSASPQKGRFRDFLRTSLINQIINYQKRRAKTLTADGALEPAESPPECSEADQEFLAHWRKTLLDRAWQALLKLQQKTQAPYHDVLRLRAEQPEMTSQALADRWNAERNPAQPYTAAAVRKVTQRARDMFSDLLVDEIARSLHDDSIEALEQEVIDLGLQAWCKDSLQRRHQTSDQRRGA